MKNQTFRTELGKLHVIAAYMTIPIWGDGMEITTGQLRLVVIASKFCIVFEVYRVRGELHPSLLRQDVAN
ncbi:hypothetical protein [Sporosarcina sp. NPDC096371]|uniref:hypothetical protein n=1 Tax=Sporosarcina sp. NPDC096371 TaxID=3364530 RepID=UPI0037FA9CDE